MNNAFKFANQFGITTRNSIDKANMWWDLTRIAMAKMLSKYAIEVLWKTPDSKKSIQFEDVDSGMDRNYDNGVTLAYQLWIMWVGIKNFRPNDTVTRAEFATALSRLLYGTKDSTNFYYTSHINKLYEKWIIEKKDPNLKELRWYVMLMLMRSAMKNDVR